MSVLDRLLAEAPGSFVKRINRKNGGRTWEVCISTTGGKQTWVLIQVPSK